MHITGIGSTSPTRRTESEQRAPSNTLQTRIVSIRNVPAAAHWQALKNHVTPTHQIGLAFDRASYGFESLTRNTLSGVEKTVRYMNTEDRKACQATLIAGKACINGAPINPQRSAPTSCNTWLRESDRFAYALARSQPGQSPELFVLKHVEGELHHTSPVAGRDVLDAGFMSIRNGNISYIENRSGHYKPLIESKLNTLAFLHQGQVNLAKVFVSERVEQKDMFGNSIVADEDAIDLAFSNKHALYNAADAYNARSFSGLERMQSSDGEYDLADKTRVRWP